MRKRKKPKPKQNKKAKNGPPQKRRSSEDNKRGEEGIVSTKPFADPERHTIARYSGTNRRRVQGPSLTDHHTFATKRRIKE